MRKQIFWILILEFFFANGLKGFALLKTFNENIEKVSERFKNADLMNKYRVFEIKFGKFKEKIF